MTIKEMLPPEKIEYRKEIKMYREIFYFIAFRYFYVRHLLDHPNQA